MTSLQQQYADLLSLTQRYLSEETAGAKHVTVDPECYLFFKNFAQNCKSRQEAPPVPVAKNTPAARPPLYPPAATATPSALTKEPTITPAATSPRPPIQSAHKLAETPSSKLRGEPQKSPVKATETLTKSASKSSPPQLHSIELEPLPMNMETDLTDIAQSVAKLFPELEILKTVPDDSIARQKRTPPPEVLVVTGELSTEHRTFLEAVVKAINDKLARCQLISKNPNEGTLDQSFLNHPDMRLVIASQEIAPTLPSPLPNGSLLISLESIEDYLSNPELKAQLWRRLCQELRKP